jgi:hypothetical protein
MGWNIVLASALGETMKVEDFPNLMVVKRLIAPIDLSQKKLLGISSQLKEAKSEVVVHGLLVMAVSTMETMFGDVIEYFLRSFPQKLPSSEFKFDKESFFDNYFTLLKKAIETHIIGLSYKSFEEFFRRALEHLGIEWSDFFDVLGNDIKEIKATRNLLLHNNLVTNDQYLETAGPAKRELDRGIQLKVDSAYLQKTVSVLMSFEEELRNRLTEKYKEYTKITAAKRLWSYLFQSPVMLFDDFWNYSEALDRITSFKRVDFHDFLSSSETFLLSLWLVHFNGNAKYMTRFNMRYFDSKYQEKVFLFLSVASEFEFE